MEGVQQIKRESDSLDDFEHLGHDSSPLKTDDLLGLNASIDGTHVRGEHTKIDTEPEFSTKLPQAGDSLLDKPLQPEKMDSNLLEFNNPFPDRKAADEKLDKFLQDMSAPFSSTEPKIPTDNLHSFLENERGSSKDVFPEKEAEKGSTEYLEKYSDSEPESDDFKLSKKSSDVEPVKQQDTFKDVQEELPKKVFEPKQDVPEPPKPEPKLPEKKPEPAPVVCEKKPPSSSQKIEAEALFCKMGLDAWFNPQRLNPKVESLIYWRDPKKSGPVFGGVLLILLALTYFSLISVIAYLSLIALSGTIAFRIYKNIVQAVQKTGDGHPFKEYLEANVALSQDKVKEVSEVAVAHLNAAFIELRRLFFVEDLVDSIKFAVFLWVLTYLGAWFNGMTLVIIAWVALFSLPKVYEANQAQIDANLEIVRTKIAEITAKVRAAIPIGKKSEEKKE